MKKVIALLMIFVVIIGCGSGVEAKSKKKKSKWKIVGYETKYIKTKVKYKTKTYLGTFYITHYCPCAECCGPGGGKVTASGTTPVAGRTVGVNPAIIPYGTKLQIGKTDGYVAEDTGGGIGTYHIDIFCNSHQEALNAGVGYKKVYAIKWKTKKKKIKVKVPIYQTEIKTGDRKGLYTTVIFRYHEPIVVKKDSDAANDTLIAIAYANAKRIMGSNSHFKKRADKNTIKIGKDYVVSVLSTVFVPGEILKRKRWDIYTYVAVQELFKRYSTKDIIDAIENVTYTVKEK